MDFNRNDRFPDTSLVLLSFLKQKGCQNSQLQRELVYLDEQLNLPTNHNYIESDEEIQADGHSFSVSYRELLHEFQNQVQPQLPVNAEEAQAAREMAAELIRIADLLEHRVLSQAADSLTKKLCSSQEQASAPKANTAAMATRAAPPYSSTGRSEDSGCGTDFICTSGGVRTGRSWTREEVFRSTSGSISCSRVAWTTSGSRSDGGDDCGSTGAGTG
uniref:BH3-interacting domain death agonist n=1 Tax=Cyprinus carpio carpio TaxID=630221 RepID=A0A8C1FEN9_CYPCA